MWSLKWLARVMYDLKTYECIVWYAKLVYYKIYKGFFILKCDQLVYFVSNWMPSGYLMQLLLQEKIRNFVPNNL